MWLREDTTNYQHQKKLVLYRHKRKIEASAITIEGQNKWKTLQNACLPVKSVLKPHHVA